jgi:hypothetical protein
MITLGGHTELECCDSLDPFSEGIIFSVMPPKELENFLVEKGIRMFSNVHFIILDIIEYLFCQNTNT